MVWLKPSAGTDIPDSDILQAAYDFDALSLSDGDEITSISDVSGNGYSATGSGATFRTGVGSGHAAGEFDGLDDFLDVSWAAISQPITTAHVVQITATDGDSRYTFMDTEQNASSFFLNRWETSSNSNSGWNIFSGAGVGTGGSLTNDFVIFVTLHDGTNSRIRVNAGNIADVTGDAGTNDLSGMSLGLRHDQSDGLDGRLAWSGIWDGAANKGDIETYLNGKFSVY